MPKHKEPSGAAILRLQDTLKLKEILQRHDYELAKAKGEATSGAELTSITSVSPSAALSAKKGPAVQPNKEAEKIKAAELSAGAGAVPSKTKPEDDKPEDDKNVKATEKPKSKDGNDKQPGKSDSEQEPINIWDLLFQVAGGSLGILQSKFVDIPQKNLAESAKETQQSRKEMKELLDSKVLEKGEVEQARKEGFKQAAREKLTLDASALNLSVRSCKSNVKASKQKLDSIYQEMEKSFNSQQYKFERLSSDPSLLGKAKVLGEAALTPMTLGAYNTKFASGLAANTKKLKKKKQEKAELEELLENTSDVMEKSKIEKQIKSVDKDIAKYSKIEVRNQDLMKRFKEAQADYLKDVTALAKVQRLSDVSNMLNHARVSQAELDENPQMQAELLKFFDENQGKLDTINENNDKLESIEEEISSLKSQKDSNAKNKKLERLEKDKSHLTEKNKKINDELRSSLESIIGPGLPPPPPRLSEKFSDEDFRKITKMQASIKADKQKLAELQQAKHDTSDKIKKLKDEGAQVGQSFPPDGSGRKEEREKELKDLQEKLVNSSKQEAELQGSIQKQETELEQFKEYAISAPLQDDALDIPLPPPLPPSHSSVLPKGGKPAPSIIKKGDTALHKSAGAKTNAQPLAPKPKQSKSLWQKVTSFLTKDNSGAEQLPHGDEVEIDDNIGVAALRTDETQSGVGAEKRTLSKQQVGSTFGDESYELGQINNLGLKSDTDVPKQSSSDNSPPPTVP